MAGRHQHTPGRPAGLAGRELPPVPPVAMARQPQQTPTWNPQAGRYISGEKGRQGKANAQQVTVGDNHVDAQEFINQLHGNPTYSSEGASDYEAIDDDDWCMRARDFLSCSRLFSGVKAIVVMATLTISLILIVMPFTTPRPDFDMSPLSKTAGAAEFPFTIFIQSVAVTVWLLQWSRFT
uniref:Uncharacterized protein n=1 Tax=Branchiostoma floridae TaxID=7739 RepID=C3ZYF4_BRAFL|eukprot:XP_002586417.1 hypothetical protein BRAFLDRAFT_107696 [Branchiostoma floridae]